MNEYFFFEKKELWMKEINVNVHVWVSLNRRRKLEGDSALSDQKRRKTTRKIAKDKVNWER